MRSFSIFLLSFLSIYGLVHAYAYIKLHFLIPWKRPWTYIVPLLFLLLLVSPVLGHLMAAKGLERSAFLFLLVGYEWMALIFLFLIAHVFLDAVRIPLFLLQRCSRRARPWKSFPRSVYFMVSAAALLTFAYGHFEARAIRLNRIELVSSKLPANANPLRIVQISDLHFSAINGIGSARRVARHIESLAPDIIVATGDLIDRGMEDPEEIARIFESIDAPLGKYAVTGNHEVYNGLEGSVRFLESMGFQVLRGEASTPLPWLSMVGVDDEAVNRVGGPKGISLEALLKGVPRENLVIFLRHRPIVSDAAIGHVDLQLSGHTHGGQIFPFGFVVARAFPYLKGFYELGKGTKLYVNRGTGTWGPPVRVGSPPEITLIVYRAGEAAR